MPWPRFGEFETRSNLNLLTFEKHQGHILAADDIASRLTFPNARVVFLWHSRTPPCDTTRCPRAETRRPRTPRWSRLQTSSDRNRWVEHALLCRRHPRN